VPQGIYTLANDNVCDSLLALLNSIEANWGTDVPICIIPYDDRLDRVSAEIADRDNVFLLDESEIVDKWMRFISQFQELYDRYPYEPAAVKQSSPLNYHRKYCTFDGPFDRFIFLDCDTLVFQPLDYVFSKLDDYDFVVHDYQRVTSVRLRAVQNFWEIFKPVYGDRYTPDTFAERFHCSGFWATRKGAISTEDLENILQDLGNGDIKAFKTALTEQDILNYMTLKKQFSLYNFTLDKASKYNTGSCVSSPHFHEKDGVLYDRDRKLTYLHYMGIKNKRLKKLVRWTEMNLPHSDFLFYLTDKIANWKLQAIPYKNLFLRYRFMPR